MNAEEARALTEHVVSAGLAYIEGVKRLWSERAWEVLGYASWEAFTDAELRGLPKLDHAERVSAAVELHATGMSKRAIAPVLGVDAHTVRRDLAPGANAPPTAPERVTGGDGKSYPAAAAAAVVVVPAAAPATQVVSITSHAAKGADKALGDYADSVQAAITTLRCPKRAETASPEIRQAAVWALRQLAHNLLTQAEVLDTNTAQETAK